MNSIPANRDVKDHILDTAQRIMGSRGFSAVGLNEILTSSGVPKGSFYHYFGSKEAFGVALLERYFSLYMTGLNQLLDSNQGTAVSRLMDYWQRWVDTQAGTDLQGRCLVVKLGAEVSDLSEDMRQVLEQGTSQLLARLTREIALAQQEGDVEPSVDPAELADALYQMWLGASMLAKVTHTGKPLASALATTSRLLSRT
ncbi:TetR/AcrR family transcriptional regulator [Gallaecimonas pentaromativorans]|uniref:TetR family transcriptional regulator n=1 Tax=Gallaecimonas pentaromativorans TaxID=584787 RepID=A0A3N1NYU7_9GAMM|nr:TetR/AcrR family transcriptional regulator [Gallaecimonas pentaromativorans]MED5524915.1 TetR/AcrR family transcriptional regulator [Pseudomonadota bacterium]ROQ24142.1 TetR family transcriptional regulator [Gallaecimonas pentaromativorans]